MHVLIVGGGIGGLAAALSLHAAGIDCTVFEQVRELRELGVGINTLPHAIKELAALGLLPALDRAGIRTRELIYANRFGQVVWRELRGTDAGFDTPQFSIHRGKLHGVLLDAVRERLGADKVRGGCRLVSFTERGDRVRGTVRATRRRRTVHRRAATRWSAPTASIPPLRAAFYPNEGRAGVERHDAMARRRRLAGPCRWPHHGDRRRAWRQSSCSTRSTSIPRRPQRRLTNWAVMARVADPPARRRRGARTGTGPGEWDEVEPFMRDRFRLDFVDPLALIRASGTFYEYPLCDREPLPRWSFGRATLLGDAAHPMYPVGSNGASQAVLDARSLARHLACGAPVPQALAAYDAERRPMTDRDRAEQSQGRPGARDRRAGGTRPDGFTDVDAVASHAEREAIVRGYASMAGFAREQVNRGR